MIVDVVVVQVVVIYMCTRLMSNLTQAYIPLFLIDTLNLPKVRMSFSVCMGAKRRLCSLYRG